MRDPAEIDGRDGRRRLDAGPPRSSGLTLLGLLAGVVLVAVVIGQLTTPDPAPRRPPTAVAPTFEIERAPEPSLPIGVDSLKRCPVELGGFILANDLRVRGYAVERWDCNALLSGPRSIVIRATGGHFGVRSAVSTFPVDRVGAGIPSVKPPNGLWNPGAQRLLWPLGDAHAQIVGDLGQTTLEDLAVRITAASGRPRFAALDGFILGEEVTYRSPLTHEMRYKAKDLGLEDKLGDGLVYTGVTSGASFESELFASHGKPAGLVRGSPAVFAEVLDGNRTLAWESTPGQVTYIGFDGTSTESVAITTLRGLADKGTVLTPAQWATKDRVPIGSLTR